MSCFDLEHKSRGVGMGEYWGLKFCKFVFLMDLGWLDNEMGVPCW